MIGKEEKKDKGKERINPLHHREDKDLIVKALQKYYKSQSTFRQGITERQESITHSFINLSIIPRNLQQQKEQALGEDEDQQAAKPDEESTANDNTKEAFARDERLASYEALHTNPEPIALENLFKQEASSSKAKQRLLVLGRAGIGKTTLSQHIAYRWAINDLWPQFTYVFWLPLRNLNQPHYQNVDDLSLALLIAQECFKKASADTISVDAIQAILTDKANQTLLILDGYDEVPHLVDSDNALGQVLHQALTFPNLLITSRPYAAPDNKWFDHCLEVMGFTNENILTYVANYFNHDEVKQPQEVEPLQQFLKDNPNIWGTAHVPITLALICNAWEQAVAEGKTLNVRLTLTGLYLNLVQDLLKRFVARQGKLIYEAQPKWLEKQSRAATKTLEALAAKGLASQQLILTQSLQQDVLASLDKAKAEQALNEAVSLGLLQPIGAQQAKSLATSHYFIHLTFQEFFAARYYVHGLQQASDSRAHQDALIFIREHKYNPFYQLVFWFMAGLLSASEKERPLILFWQTLLAKPHDLIGLAHLRLIIHCLDEAQIDNRIPQRDNLLNYLEQALEAAVLGKKRGFHVQSTGGGKYFDSLEHLFSQFLLSELSHTTFLNQDPQFFNRLIVFAKSNNVKAINALAKLNLTGKAIDLLSTQAVNNNNIEVKEAAILALGEVKDPSSAVINLLCERSMQFNRDRERRAAFAALGKLANFSSDASDLLVKQTTEGNEHWVRQSAIEALGNLTNPSEGIINLLWDQIKQEDHFRIREAAVVALGKLTNSSLVTTDLLCTETIDQEDAIKIAAGKLTHPPTNFIDLLCERAMQDEDKQIKKIAMNTLSYFSPRRLLEAYLDCFNQAFSPLLASYSAKRVMRQQAGLTITENKLTLYTHQPFVFELSPQCKPQIIKDLLSACQTLRQEYRLPTVVDLNKLPLAIIEESMLCVQEKRATFLSLKDQGISDRNVKRLVKFMLAFPTLHSLDLSDNAITNKGVSSLVKVLANNYQLTELNLAQNQIANAGAKALLRALKGEKVTSKVQRRVSSYSKPNNTLCHLELSNNIQISSEVLDKIRERLACNKQLAQASQCLLKSIKKNDLAAIKQALKAGALLTAMTKQGHGPLHVAACYGYQKAAHYLIIKHSACLNWLNRDGLSAFYLACVKGQWDIAEYLLARGADIHALDYQGRSALHHAAQHHEFIVLKYLLTKMVKDLSKINLADKDGSTPLHYAILAQNEHNVRLLIKAGANPTLSNKQGKTPLILASELCNPCLIGYVENALLSQPAASSVSSSSSVALPVPQADNWVRIYLWPSQLKQRSLGHIALETTNFYVSFWPQNYHLQDGLKAVDSAFAANVDEDIQAEAFKKPQVYCLYSLDVKEINAEFVRFCQKPRQWALKGRKQSETTQNCSGLVYELLVAGGIEQLATINWSTKALPTPNAIGQVVQQAQQAERQQYPIVATYTPTSALPAQQQVSVQHQEEGQFIVSLVQKLDKRFDEQTELHKARWENEDLAREAQTLKIERSILRLEQQISASSVSFFAPPGFAQAATTSAAALEDSTDTSSDEEVDCTESP